MATSGLAEQVRLLVGPKVDEVERSLVRHLTDCPAFLRDATAGVLQRGGKRLRPYLHLLAADLLGYEGTDDVLHATIVEYLHVASLVHDDVIDEATLRRGSPTLNQSIGNTTSVLVGDYLCVKALALAAEVGTPEALALITRTTLDLIEGEALQEALVGRLDVTEEECLRAIELKTARLMATSCETAALLVGEAPGSALRVRMREYGLQLGLAFQLTDDILDFTSDEETLGKPVLNDLCEGKLSMPAIHALRTGGPGARRVLAAVIEDHGLARVSAEEVVRVVEETGGLDETAAAAGQAAARAREALTGLPPGPSLDALLFATDYAIHRSF